MVKKREVSPFQANLLTGMTQRQEQRIQNCKAQLEELQQTIGFVQYLLSSEEKPSPIVITAMNLERYPNRLGPIDWWLTTEDGWLDANGLSDYPKADDYKWGGYACHEEETENFVRDRAKWILPILLEEQKEAQETLAELEGKTN